MSIETTNNVAFPAYEEALNIIRENQSQVVEIIKGSKTGDETLPVAEGTKLDNLHETLFSEVFTISSENIELPVINQVKEDMYDAVAATVRLSKITDLSRDWYYTKAIGGYNKLNTKSKLLAQVVNVAVQKHLDYINGLAK